VQRFADDGLEMEEIPVAAPRRGGRKSGAVSDRMAALRDIASRT
jgi:hypothetical protein